jgi:hypothetical protein
MSAGLNELVTNIATSAAARCNIAIYSSIPLIAAKATNAETISGYFLPIKKAFVLSDLENAAIFPIICS